MQQKQPRQPAPQRRRRQVVRACGRARAHRCTHREAELRRVRVRPEQRLAERRMRSPCRGGVSPVLPRSAPLDVRRRGPWSLRLTDRLHRNGRVRVASRLVVPVGLAEVLWRGSRQSPSRRPRQWEQLQWPFRVHLCGGGVIKATDCGGNGARAASGAWERTHRHRCLKVCPRRNLGRGVFASETCLRFSPSRQISVVQFGG